MTKTDYLAKAKDCIAKGESYYHEAVKAILAARKENSGRTTREEAAVVGMSRQWIADLVKWHTSGPAAPPTPFAGKEEPGAQAQRAAKQVLRDPERRREVLRDLTSDERTEVVRDISRTTTDDDVAEDDEIEVPDLDEAVAADLTAQVSKLVHTASRIDVLLADHGALFRRIDADEAGRLDDDLERAVRTIRAVRAELLKHREIEVQA